MDWLRNLIDFTASSRITNLDDVVGHAQTAAASDDPRMRTQYLCKLLDICRSLEDIQMAADAGALEGLFIVTVRPGASHVALSDAEKRLAAQILALLTSSSKGSTLALSARFRAHFFLLIADLLGVSLMRSPWFALAVHAPHHVAAPKPAGVPPTPGVPSLPPGDSTTPPSTIDSRSAAPKTTPSTQGHNDEQRVIPDERPSASTLPLGSVHSASGDTASRHADVSVRGGHLRLSPGPVVGAGSAVAGAAPSVRGVDGVPPRGGGSPEIRSPAVDGDGVDAFAVDGASAGQRLLKDAESSLSAVVRGSSVPLPPVDHYEAGMLSGGGPALITPPGSLAKGHHGIGVSAVPSDRTQGSGRDKLLRPTEILGAAVSRMVPFDVGRRGHVPMTSSEDVVRLAEGALCHVMARTDPAVKRDAVVAGALLALLAIVLARLTAVESHKTRPTHIEDLLRLLNGLRILGLWPAAHMALDVPVPVLREAIASVASASEKGASSRVEEADWASPRLDQTPADTIALLRKGSSDDLHLEAEDAGYVDAHSGKSVSLEWGGKSSSGAYARSLLEWRKFGPLSMNVNVGGGGSVPGLLPTLSALLAFAESPVRIAAAEVVGVLSLSRRFVLTLCDRSLPSSVVGRVGNMLFCPRIAERIAGVTAIVCALDTLPAAQMVFLQTFTLPLANTLRSVSRQVRPTGITNHGSLVSRTDQRLLNISGLGMLLLLRSRKVRSQELYMQGACSSLVAMLDASYLEVVRFALGALLELASETFVCVFCRCAVKAGRTRWFCPECQDIHWCDACYRAVGHGPLELRGDPSAHRAQPYNWRSMIVEGGAVRAVTQLALLGGQYHEALTLAAECDESARNEGMPAPTLGLVRARDLACHDHGPPHRTSQRTVVQPKSFGGGYSALYLPRSVHVSNDESGDGEDISPAVSDDLSDDDLIDLMMGIRDDRLMEQRMSQAGTSSQPHRGSFSGTGTGDGTQSASAGGQQSHTVTTNASINAQNSSNRSQAAEKSRSSATRTRRRLSLGEEDSEELSSGIRNPDTDYVRMWPRMGPAQQTGTLSRMALELLTLLAEDPLTHPQMLDEHCEAAIVSHLSDHISASPQMALRLLGHLADSAHERALLLETDLLGVAVEIASDPRRRTEELAMAARAVALLGTQSNSPVEQLRFLQNVVPRLLPLADRESGDVQFWLVQSLRRLLVSESSLGRPYPAPSETLLLGALSVTNNAEPPSIGSVDSAMAQTARPRAASHSTMISPQEDECVVQDGSVGPRDALGGSVGASDTAQPVVNAGFSKLLQTIGMAAVNVVTTTSSRPAMRAALDVLATVLRLDARLELTQERILTPLSDRYEEVRGDIVRLCRSVATAAVSQFADALHLCADAAVFPLTCMQYRQLPSEVRSVDLDVLFQGGVDANEPSLQTTGRGDSERGIAGVWAAAVGDSEKEDSMVAVLFTLQLKLQQFMLSDTNVFGKRSEILRSNTTNLSSSDAVGAQTSTDRRARASESETSDASDDRGFHAAKRSMDLPPLETMLETVMHCDMLESGHLAPIDDNVVVRSMQLPQNRFTQAAPSSHGTQSRGPNPPSSAHTHTAQLLETGLSPLDSALLSFRQSIADIRLAVQNIESHLAFLTMFDRVMAHLLRCLVMYWRRLGESGKLSEARALLVPMAERAVQGESKSLWVRLSMSDDVFVNVCLAESLRNISQHLEASFIGSEQRPVFRFIFDCLERVAHRVLQRVGTIPILTPPLLHLLPDTPPTVDPVPSVAVISEGMGSDEEVAVSLPAPSIAALDVQTILIVVTLRCAAKCFSNLAAGCQLGDSGVRTSYGTSLSKTTFSAPSNGDLHRANMNVSNTAPIAVRSSLRSDRRSWPAGGVVPTVTFSNEAMVAPLDMEIRGPPSFLRTAEGVSGAENGPSNPLETGLGLGADVSAGDRPLGEDTDGREQALPLPMPVFPPSTDEGDGGFGQPIDRSLDEADGTELPGDDMDAADAPGASLYSHSGVPGDGVREAGGVPLTAAQRHTAPNTTSSITSNSSDRSRLALPVHFSLTQRTLLILLGLADVPDQVTQHAAVRAMFNFTIAGAITASGVNGGNLALMSSPQQIAVPFFPPASPLRDAAGYAGTAARQPFPCPAPKGVDEESHSSSSHAGDSSGGPRDGDVAKSSSAAVQKGDDGGQRASGPMRRFKCYVSGNANDCRYLLMKPNVTYEEFSERLNQEFALMMMQRDQQQRDDLKAGGLAVCQSVYAVAFRTDFAARTHAARPQGNGQRPITGTVIDGNRSLRDVLASSPPTSVIFLKIRPSRSARGNEHATAPAALSANEAQTEGGGQSTSGDGGPAATGAETSASVTVALKGPRKPNFNWKKGQLLGRGAYGAVYKAMDLDSGEFLAVKEVNMRPGTLSARELEMITSELDLLQNLDHPNVVRFHGKLRSSNKVYIFLELIDCGSISQLVQVYGALSVKVVQTYLLQVLSGLKYLHEQGVVHRDLKGGNILIDQSGNVKLADFGAARRIQELAVTEGLVGTPYFLAPEVISHRRYSTKSDVWSLGSTVYEMLTGERPWAKLDRQQVQFQILTKGAPPLPTVWSQPTRDFLERCFVMNPDKRATVDELLEMPFVAEAAAERRVPAPLPSMAAVQAATGMASLPPDLGQVDRNDGDWSEAEDDAYLSTTDESV